MRARSLLLLGGIALASTGGLCGGPGGPPPDSCDSPRGAMIEQLEVGEGTESQFVALVDQQAVRAAIGPQGGAMLPIRIKLTGSNLPACLEQRSSLKLENEEFAVSMAFLNTYAQPDGSRTTHAHYLIFGPGKNHLADGKDLVLTTSALGKTVIRTLHLGYRETRD